MTKAKKVTLIAQSEHIAALLLDAKQLPQDMPGTDWNPRATKVKRAGFIAKSQADQLYWLLSGGKQPDWGIASVAAKSAAFISRRADRVEDGFEDDDSLEDSRAISHHDDMMAEALAAEFDALVLIYEDASDEKYKNPTYAHVQVKQVGVSKETAARAAKFAA